MRYRINYEKRREIQFTSTLDIQLIWERSLRRAGIQLHYSEGFHPNPKIQIGLPLPLGFTSKDEIVDVWVNNEQKLHKLHLQQFLPIGLWVINIEEIAENNKSFSSTVVYADYHLMVKKNTISQMNLLNKINAIRDSETLIRKKRNGKKYDLRQLIDRIELEENNLIYVRLSAEPSKTGRPDDLLEEMGIPRLDCKIDRVNIITK